MLIHHWPPDIALNTLPPSDDYVGIICTEAVSTSLHIRSSDFQLTTTLSARHSQNISEICAESIDNATFVCAEHYALFKAPRIDIVCDPDLHFPYVPGHLFVVRFS